MKKRHLIVKWILCAIPAVIALLIYFILPYFPKIAEFVFVRGIFRIVAFPLEWIMSVFPFSVTEAVVILATPAIITLGIIFTVRIVKSQNKNSTVEKGLRFVCWCLSLALLMFMITDGANFSRIPVSQLFELPDKKYTKEELHALTVHLAEEASAAREKLDEDENGCVKLSVSRSELLKLADDCYDGLQEEYPYLKTAVWRVKSVALSHWWSYTGYTGVYCPWLLEASINTDVPVHELGHTATHEIAHTMGFAKENECNFLAWLACAQSGQADYVYSGYQQAYIYCSNALYRADKELWREAFSHCSKGMIRDMKRSNEYWDSFEGEVQETSQKFNDTFIKVNGVESGVLSYNEMVELMLKYFDKTGMFKAQ